MKRPCVGDRIRITVHLLATITSIEEKNNRACVYWKRGKGVTIRESERYCPLTDIIPSDTSDYKNGIAWRLVFYFDDNRGAMTTENKSTQQAGPTRPWTPYNG